MIASILAATIAISAHTPYPLTPSRHVVMASHSGAPRPYPLLDAGRFPLSESAPAGEAPAGEAPDMPPVPVSDGVSEGPTSPPSPMLVGVHWQVEEALELRDGEDMRFYDPNERGIRWEGMSRRVLLTNEEITQVLSGGVKLGVEYSIPMRAFELAPWIAADYGYLPVQRGSTWRVGSISAGIELRRVLSR